MQFLQLKQRVIDGLVVLSSGIAETRRHADELLKVADGHPELTPGVEELITTLDETAAQIRTLKEQLKKPS